MARMEWSTGRSSDLHGPHRVPIATRDLTFLPFIYRAAVIVSARDRRIPDGCFSPGSRCGRAESLLSCHVMSICALLELQFPSCIREFLSLGSSSTPASPPNPLHRDICAHRKPHQCQETNGVPIV